MQECGGNGEAPSPPNNHGDNGLIEMRPIRPLELILIFQNKFI